MSKVTEESARFQTWTRFNQLRRQLGAEPVPFDDLMGDLDIDAAEQQWLSDDSGSDSDTEPSRPDDDQRNGSRPSLPQRANNPNALPYVYTPSPPPPRGPRRHQWRRPDVVPLDEHEVMRTVRRARAAATAGDDGHRRWGWDRHSVGWGRDEAAADGRVRTLWGREAHRLTAPLLDALVDRGVRRGEESQYLWAFVEQAGPGESDPEAEYDPLRANPLLPAGVVQLRVRRDGRCALNMDSLDWHDLYFPEAVAQWARKAYEVDGDDNDGGVWDDRWFVRPEVRDPMPYWAPLYLAVVHNPPAHNPRGIVDVLWHHWAYAPCYVFVRLARPSSSPRRGGPY